MAAIQRESVSLDVLFVGGGPAGLAGAIRLKQLVDGHNEGGQGEPLELEIGIIDKAREFGRQTITTGMPMESKPVTLATRVIPITGSKPRNLATVSSGGPSRWVPNR